MSDGGGPSFLLAIDQGTSSTRTVLYDLHLRPQLRADRPLATSHPRPGWSEQSPTEILEGVVDTVAEVLAQVPQGARVMAAGLANQGETVVAWDGRSGDPLAPAVTWQCRRSEGIVEGLRATGLGPTVRGLTGLPLDAYFSAGKMTWLLDHEPQVAAAARDGRLRLGTVDAWLTDRLGGWPLTDPSTASRTQLLGLRSLRWEPSLLDAFRVPAGALPTVLPTTGRLATLQHPTWPHPLELTAAACDQQAALAGHGGFVEGATKVTFGTGAFAVANAGPEAPSTEELEVSVGWLLEGSAPDYVLQGGVLSAASLLAWMGEDLGLPLEPLMVGQLAASVPDAGGIMVLPALAGLGAPWYRDDARVVIRGLGAGTTAAHLARAALDAICHRVCDLLDALERAGVPRPASLRVDGGLTRVPWLMQRQADLSGLPLAVARDAEATARGVALLAGLGAGILDPAAVAPAAIERTIAPRLDPAARAAERAAWRRFVERAVDV